MLLYLRHAQQSHWKVIFAMLTCLHMAVQVWGENMWRIYHYCTAAALVIFVCPILFGRTRGGGAQGARGAEYVRAEDQWEEKSISPCAQKNRKRKQKTHPHIINRRTHANIINTQRKPRWIWCKLFSLAATPPFPPLPPPPQPHPSPVQQSCHSGSTHNEG